MIKKSAIQVSIAFASGILIGVASLALLSFSFQPSVSPTPVEVEKLSVTQANSYLKNYLKTAQTINSPLKAMLIDKDQLIVMNRLINENPSLAGFRIYMGKDENSAKVGMVVGVNNNGNDLTSTIYRSNGTNLSPCPPICDGAGTLNGD
jgi:hypothetical protein